jgi:glycosyltransferase involved in cell wall biosynthesis
MFSFFAQADALLVTLKKDPVFALTVPGKVPSYMASGRPILAALDGEGAALITEARAGFVVPSGDAPRLADMALTMSRLPGSERSEMGRSAKQYCKTHFDRKKLFSLLESHLQDLAGDTSSKLHNGSSSPSAG